MTSAVAAAEEASIVETHVSVLVFVGDRAYKAKKPVRFGFLDFSTPARRREACQREVELNRRIAPDVYLGVAELRGPGPDEAEPVVVMRRMPVARRLATMVVEDDPSVADHLRAVARVLVDFHARAERSPAIDTHGTAGALAAAWQANEVEMASFVGRLLDVDLFDEAHRLLERFVAGRRTLFDRRIAAGEVCDGHGDLQAADIFCLDDGPRILDTIEFDDSLRYGDVLADVAFLTMDLERLGRPDLGEVFVAAYDELAGEVPPRPLLEVHVAHRAQIRAKVACLRAEQDGLDTAAGAAAAEEARRLQRLSVEHLRRARVRLVVVGGLPGTGKSTLARGLGERFGWVVLRSDVLRKQLAGLDAATPAPANVGAGIYDDAATDRTYDELLVEASHLLAAGETVILDASWSDDRHRRAARELAEAASADLVELCCTVAPDVARERLRSRAATGGDASDATDAVAVAMAARADEWPEAVDVPTAAGPDVVLDSVATTFDPTVT